MNFRRYLVLAAMVVFGAVGDVCLSRGMKSIGAISLAHWPQLIPAVFNPWVALGIAFLLVFFVSYSTALSWALGVVTRVETGSAGGRGGSLVSRGRRRR